MAKPIVGMGDDELLDLISKAKSNDDIQKILLNSGRDLSDAQALNSDVLGSLIEKRFGTEEVRSSAALNDYLTKIKQSDYPALDETRRLLYPDAKDVSATYGKGYFGDGTFYGNPTLETPIRLGGTPITNDDYTDARAKRVLGHELSHANDLLAIHLKRLQKADPEQYKKLTERIGNISRGGEAFLQHSENIANRYPTAAANMLTPEKADILESIIRDQSPSVSREKHLQLINNYKKALTQETPDSPDKALMERYMGVDRKKIPDVPGEAVQFTPDREYVTKALESEFDPIKAESIRSQGHHATRPDIADDVGHYEGRNIKRLSKGDGLLGVTGPLGAAVESVKDLYKEAPIEESSKLGRLHGISTVAAKALGPLAIASGVIPVAADIKEGKPNTALARAVSYAAPMGAEDLTDKLMQTADISDTSPELQDPEYRKLLMRIGQKRVERGGSPVIKSFSGREVDTSKTEDSDFLNRIKALQDLKTQG
jgi:hypothetical protein